MRVSIVVLSVMLAPMAAYAGQSIQGMLSAGDVQKELFGIRMRGVMGVSDTPWSECIEPDGDTVYRVGKTVLTGQAYTQDGGALCFSYEAQAARVENCFSVSRDARGGYVFSSEARTGSVFRTQSVQRNIKACPKGPGDVS